MFPNNSNNAGGANDGQLNPLPPQNPMPPANDQYSVGQNYAAQEFDAHGMPITQNQFGQAQPQMPDPSPAPQYNQGGGDAPMYNQGPAGVPTMPQVPSVEPVAPPPAAPLPDEMETQFARLDQSAQAALPPEPVAPPPRPTMVDGGPLPVSALPQNPQLSNTQNQVPQVAPVAPNEFDAQSISSAPSAPAPVPPQPNNVPTNYFEPPNPAGNLAGQNLNQGQQVQFAAPFVPESSGPIVTADPTAGQRKKWLIIGGGALALVLLVLAFIFLILPLFRGGDKTPAYSTNDLTVVTYDKASAKAGSDWASENADNQTSWTDYVKADDPSKGLNAQVVLSTMKYSNETLTDKKYNDSKSKIVNDFMANTDVSKIVSSDCQIPSGTTPTEQSTSSGGLAGAEIVFNCTQAVSGANMSMKMKVLFTPDGTAYVFARSATQDAVTANGDFFAQIDDSFMVSD